MMEYFTLNLTKGTEVLNGIKIEKQGFNLTKLVGAQGKHAMQSCKIQVRGKNVIDFLIKATGYVFAKVFDGAECIYEGVIKPYITVNANTSSAESISLDIMDYTELLDKRVFNDITSIGVATNEDVIIARSWKNQSVRAILIALFALCGIDQHVNIEFESAPGLDITFVDFRIVDGDNIHDVIDSLCYEALIDYRFDVGKVVIYDTEGNTPLADIDDYRQSAKISRTKEYDNGVKLTWQNTYTERCEIYHESNRWDEEVWRGFKIHLGGVEWHTGYYYNRDMHDNKPTGKTAQWSFKNITDKVGNIVVLNVTNANITPTLHDETGVTIEARLDSYDENGGVAYIWYDGTFNYIFGKGWGFEYSVYADVLYRKPYEVSLQRGLKPKSVRLKYLDTRLLASHFGEVYMKKQAQACYKYDFSSNQQLIPGKCYRFHENRALGVTSIVRIISSTYDHEKKIYRYKAEGANTIEVEPLEVLPPASSETIPQDMPAEEVDFFYLTADRTFFLKEETSDKATVTAHGVALRLATSIDWIFKGSNLGVHEDNVEIPVLDLAMGSNNLTCRVIIDSVPYERSVSILKTQVNDNALMQYRYGSDPKEPPYTEGGVWFWNNKAMFLGGKLIGNPDSENWIEGIPGKTEHAPYLWMRISTDGGATWTYTRLHSNDDISFKITADSTVYPMSARGATVAPTTLHLKAEKKNTTGIVTWSSAPEIFTPKTGDAIECIIPSGCQAEKITIVAAISGIGEESIVLTSYEVGSKLPVYVGDSYTLEQLEALPQHPIGLPWVDGDHALVITEGGNSIPYVYHTTIPGSNNHWEMLKKSDENVGQVMMHSLYDIVDHGCKDKTCSAVYGFFEQLAAVNAFIENLQSKNVLVQDPDNPNGMSVQMTTSGENGKPVCVIKYGTKTVLQVNPEKGNVFIGQPNSDLTAPVTGFMYNAVTDEIVTADKKIVIQSNGSARMIDADIQGTANIKNGRFNGLFDCASIYTEERKTKPVTQYVNNTRVQIEDYIKQYHSELWVNDNRQRNSGFIRCNVTGCDTVQYIKLFAKVDIHSQAGTIMEDTTNVSMFLYDKDFNPLSYNQLGLLSYYFNGYYGSYTQNEISAATEQAKYYSVKNKLTTLRDYHEGVYSPYGFEVTVYEGGNILRLNILEGPAQSTIDGMPYGQVYSTGDGTLKMSLKNR